MTNAIIEYSLIKDLHPEEFMFSALSKGTEGLKQSAWINSPNQEGGIVFQTFDPACGIGSTTLRAPFPPNEPEGDAKKYSLSLYLDSGSETPIIEFLQTLDDKVINESMKRATDYFKRPVSKNELLQMYMSAIKQPTRDGYPQMMRVRIGDARQTKIYKTLVPLSECTSLGVVPYTDASVEDIIAHSRMHIAVKLGQLWFYQKRFGVTLNANAILIDKTLDVFDARQDGFSFGKRKRNDNEKDNGTNTLMP